MNRIILTCCLVFFAKCALASGNYSNASHEAIIKKQSKQISELKGKILELDNNFEWLKTELITKGIIKNQEDTIQTESSENNSLKEEQVIFISKEKSDYDHALAAMQTGKFDIAEAEFQDFIASYPNSDLQSNANFWYSESFFRREIFDKAAINYLKTYKKYPSSTKAPDALLKLAYSLSSLNKNQEACSILKKLDLEFPNRSRDSVNRSINAKNTFNCG